MSSELHTVLLVSLEPSWSYALTEEQEAESVSSKQPSMARNCHPRLLGATRAPPVLCTNLAWPLCHCAPVLSVPKKKKPSPEISSSPPECPQDDPNTTQQMQCPTLLS